MTVTIISAEEAAEKLKQGAVLVDIREEDEYQREHIQGARLHSLSKLKVQAENLSATAEQAACVIFHCKSGMRTQGAADFLRQCCGRQQQVFILEGGLQGWRKAGFATLINRSKPIEIMRQVQIAAGGLVLLGVVLGHFVAPMFYWLSAFVGAGLMFAGISGFCGLARLLALMPWNRQK